MAKAARTAKPAPAGYSGTPLPQKLGIKPASLVWLKGAPAGFETALGGLSESFVRESGLALGIVDFKICAIDATWSGLKFQRRRTAR